MSKNVSERRPAGIAEDAKKLPRPILAEGESTGHFHEAVGDDVSLWDNGGGAAVLDAPRGATVVHQEHKPIEIPPGQFERSIVKEFDPMEEEVRNIVD